MKAELKTSDVNKDTNLKAKGENQSYLVHMWLDKQVNIVTQIALSSGVREDGEGQIKIKYDFNNGWQTAT